ncbi:MAG: sugar transferase [Candidatus Lokiarchaeota archaeon]|nr:sugar transferase [Candidatus Lokiarchaeota archaeon]
MLKRIVDIMASLFALILFSPLFLLIAILIKREARGPIFYRGLRVGQNKKTFYMLKFRTMVVDAEKRGGPTTSNSDSRITKTGAFLRKYKLDELPQLINVLKGEMSLIGPRPEIVSEVELYDPEWNVIFDVKPGITDLSSIQFRNEGEIIANSGIADAHLAYRSLIQPKKLALQREYVLNRSLVLDAKILFNTIKVVVRN